MTAYELLVKLYQRIQDPTRWANHEVQGIRYLPNGELQCGCVLQHAFDIYLKTRRPGDTSDLYTSFLRKAVGERQDPKDHPYIGQFNDTHTHGENLNMVHRAMKLAEEVTS